MGLWGCNPPKALGNQRRIKESSSTAQALGAHAPKVARLLQRCTLQSSLASEVITTCARRAQLELEARGEKYVIN